MLCTVVCSIISASALQVSSDSWIFTRDRAIAGPCAVAYHVKAIAYFAIVRKTVLSEASG